MLKQSLLCSFLALSGLTSAIPSLELPWGTYEAQELADDPKIYVFKNVRFGEIPERFQVPRFPTTTNDSVQPPTDGRSCIQIDFTKLGELPGDEEPVDGPGEGSVQGEDCLFLDLYVPKWVFEGDVTDLPVVVWIYGGAYAFGAKDQAGVLYSGRSIIAASDYQTIFVTGNYRLGAFGWLAGDYMQQSGAPNAGLYDQALLFKWVQDHISKVRGDKTEVSAWGQSAGAGSILHHLIRENGTVDPTFKTFAAQSPAFQWAWDNKPNGNLDQTYQTFSELAGCGKTFNMTCLRQSTNLTEANEALYKTFKTTGLFPLGPAVDNKWVNTIPTLAFANGEHWDAVKINSTIVSHTLNEATMFTPKYIKNKETFQSFLSAFLPGDDLAPQRKKISERYNIIRFLGDWRKRTATIIRDASFTCNTRDLFTAYEGKTHMMRYAFPDAGNAKHGADLIPLFTNNFDEAVDFMQKLNQSSIAKLYAYKLFNDNIAQTYQNYFASFAVSGGNPNTLRWKLAQGVDAPLWTPAIEAEELENVLTVRLKDLLQKPFVTSVKDGQNTKDDCEFWTQIATEVMAAQKGSVVVHEAEESVEEL